MYTSLFVVLGLCLVIGLISIFVEKIKNMSFGVQQNGEKVIMMGRMMAKERVFIKIKNFVAL